MRSRVTFGALSVLSFVAVLSVPAPAAAQGWGRAWFEQWSGPGGFTGHDLSLTPICELKKDGGDEGTITLIGRGKDGPNARWCLDVGLGFYENRDDDRPQNGEVTFKLYQATAMANPFANGALELGVGAGVARFNGDRFESFTRFYVPTRFAFKPFRLGRSSRTVKGTGIVQLVGNLHVFPNAITDEDTNFRDHSFEHHFQGNLILFFDFSSLLFRR